MFVLNDVETNLVDYKKFADEGSIEYQEKIGIYYWIKFDIDNAEKYLKLAAKGGSISAMVMLAEFYNNPPKAKSDSVTATSETFANDELKNFIFEEKANWWIKKAAENGDHYSMHSLATRYRNMQGFDKLAFEWCLRAAELGNVGAQNDVGAHYDHGDGAENDDAKAFEWYMKAARQNCAVAMFNVGLFYRNGTAVEQNHEKAFEWFMKSAQKGYGHSQNEVALYYDDNCESHEAGVINRYEAFKWYRRGAISGNKNAKYNLAYSYENSEDEKVDYEKAFVLYYELATLEKPYALACNEIGRSFLGGHGVKKDAKQAVLWFKKGANLNEPWSIDNLAYCYENGEGVKKDLEKAEKLRKRAEKLFNEKD